ncbi:hypothetical protein JQ609_33640 [Bradyrhizobium sp. AUGA SZCCT0169]|uniref:hypothetical protein n=1 Tax=Bradyrhizobium sp. AUGA SZCCT0169 TaxID=2807663 RepID=UPI001BA4E526|nr:hypothetical protein [Bradyrhizobium sp. AUGA SZCCT0169]MBR1251845.1 hypothetical protein [Bradyrhizobium sp. AUGA SZCCT0169]
MTLFASDKQIVARLARRHVEETFSALKGTIASSRWVTAANRYSVDPVAVLAGEIDNGSGQQPTELAQYIAASPVLHATDGWSYLGKSLVALLRGDPHRAIHLAYYAELRAAVSLLATEGIGIFSTNHFAITRKDTIRKFSSTLGTHRFAWSCLDHWATLPKATQLFVRMIRPQGIALEDWFLPVGGTTAIAPQAQAWLRQWGVDLRNFADDRDARNISSYQPDGIPNVWQIQGPDALEFARDLWASLEPSPLTRFDVIDRSILRIATEALFKSLTGDTAQQRPNKFRPFAESIIKPHNLSGPTETQLLRFLMRGSSPHNPTIFEHSKGPATDAATGAHAVISRAALLLRLASGASLLLLRAASLNAASIAFWSDSLGRSRGLWENALSSPMDMWADVLDALAEVEAFQQQYAQVDQTFFKIRSELSDALVNLGSPERVAIWAMTP